MNQTLYEELLKITPEEQSILDGKHEIQSDIYMSTNFSGQNILEAKKLLDEGKLIQIRKHTRFAHFPEHSHDFVEMVYMCSGQTHHIINGKDVILRQGELLILNQHSRQEILPCKTDDVAINFIILPEFFDYGLKMMDSASNRVKDFLIDCLRGDKGTADFLYFQVSDLVPVQNLIENLIWTLHNKQANRRSINQATMGLLFINLMNHIDRIHVASQSKTQQLSLAIIQYIEEHYKDGELAILADNLHYDIAWLSREIKHLTGKTYTDLVQEKRLEQAAFLLKTTALSVLEIGLSVGYENQSYFHRIFQKRFGMTPRKYRLAIQGNIDS